MLVDYSSKYKKRTEETAWEASHSSRLAWDCCRQFLWKVFVFVSRTKIVFLFVIFSTLQILHLLLYMDCSVYLVMFPLYCHFFLMMMMEQLLHTFPLCRFLSLYCRFISLIFRWWWSKCFTHSSFSFAFFSSWWWWSFIVVFFRWSLWDGQLHIRFGLLTTILAHSFMFKIC